MKNRWGAFIQNLIIVIHFSSIGTQVSQVNGRILTENMSPNQFPREVIS